MILFSFSFFFGLWTKLPGYQFNIQFMMRRMSRIRRQIPKPVLWYDFYARIKWIGDDDGDDDIKSRVQKKKNNRNTFFKCLFLFITIFFLLSSFLFFILFMLCALIFRFCLIFYQAIKILFEHFCIRMRYLILTLSIACTKWNSKFKIRWPLQCQTK